MKIAYVEFEVDDDFHKMDCAGCPFAYWSDKDNGYVCPIYYGECRVKIKKVGDKNEQQNKGGRKRH
jgi:hypothetical protein